MKNRWNYQGLGQVQYGSHDSYQVARNWLDFPGWTVEDWGCGCAYARKFFTMSKYIGIDGSKNDFADICQEDVIERKSTPEGIMLRHVLEHNERWKELLANALNCFQRRMVIVFFIDFGPETKIINRTADPKYPGVVDIQFKRSDIQDMIAPFYKTELRVDSDILLFCEKPDPKH